MHDIMIAAGQQKIFNVPLNFLGQQAQNEISDY